MIIIQGIACQRSKAKREGISMAEVDVDLLTVTPPQPEVVIAPEVVLESAIEILDPFPNPTEEIIEIVPQEISDVEVVILHNKEESKKMEVDIKEDGEDVVVKHKHKHQHKHEIHYEKETIMEPVNVFAGNPLGMMGGTGHDGLGLGGGLIGGVLLGALLGNRGGLFGGNGSGNGVDGINNIQASVDTNAILAGIADVKAAVPLAEAQVQLALAGATADITSQNMQQTIALQQQNFAGQLATCAGFANTARDIASVETTVDRSAWALSNTIKEDGERTRALITSNQIADLNQKLTVAQLEAFELRQEGRRSDDRHGIEITMTNNQNQQQLQFQAQAQAINTLGGLIHSCDQNIRATNQAINIGSGAQVANPNNNNTNVKA